MDLPNPVLDASRDEVDSPVTTTALPQRKEICIIGAGPSGLGALKILVEHLLFQSGQWSVVVYEARDSVGGVWLPADSASDADRSKTPATPLYDALTTNLPHPIMAYSSLPFPPSTPLFPPASTVLKYLESYAETFNLTQYVRFRRRVVRASWDATVGKWRVVTRAESTTDDVEVLGEEEELFDLVVVANGHYSLPRYPDTPGLQAWLDGNKATHSIYYRNPSHPACLEAVDTVLVIGAGPSGLDVSSELRTAGQKRIVHSVTGAVNEDLEDGGFKKRGRVKQFHDPEKGEVEFEDGTRECGIEHCILATGYQDYFPFLRTPELHSSFPPSIPPLPAELYNSSYHVFPLAKHIFPLVSTHPPSSLVFLGLPFRIIPFPLVEAQMRAVVTVLEHPDSLEPTREAVDIVSRYEDLRAAVLARQPSLPVSSIPFAIAKIWHMLEEQAQFDYRDALLEFAGLPEMKVPQWIREFYPLKGVLRAEWRALEKSGEAEDWVKGVGEGGMDEWIELMRRVARRADEKKRSELRTVVETKEDSERQRTRL